LFQPIQKNLLIQKNRSFLPIHLNLKYQSYLMYRLYLKYHSYLLNLKNRSFLQIQKIR
jgi:hypothetical protein